MIRLAVVALLATALALAGLIAAEFILPGPVQEADSGLPRSTRSAPVVPHVDPAKEAAEAQDHTDQWVTTILARPLFTRDRKPVDAHATATAAAGGDGPPPRLTGVTVSPIGRLAIFSGGDSGKPLVVTEGGSVGAYKVLGISPGAVRLSGPSGEQTVAPAFDPAPRKVELDPNGAPVGQPGQPTFSQPQFGQPQFGQPQFGQPGQPQFPQPGVPPQFAPGVPRVPGLQLPFPGRPRTGDGARLETTPMRTRLVASAKPFPLTPIADPA